MSLERVTTSITVTVDTTRPLDTGVVPTGGLSVGVLSTQYSICHDPEWEGGTVLVHAPRSTVVFWCRKVG